MNLTRNLNRNCMNSSPCKHKQTKTRYHAESHKTVTYYICKNPKPCPFLVFTSLDALIL